MRTVAGTVAVPTVGFGTYTPGDTSWCYEGTLQALKAGYRHLDCAWEYGVSTHYRFLLWHCSDRRRLGR